MSASGTHDAHGRPAASGAPSWSAALARPAGAPGGGLLRPAASPDPLYGEVRLAGWAAVLLATPPFERLAGVSLSDVPGAILFGRHVPAFPSRLDHARGVYHLARLARPRDRLLQAAALAHDLGHGPFSHLSEQVMRELTGGDHEARAAAALERVRAALPPAAARRLEWLDWDELAALVMGGGRDGRGALLNGRLDYDNLDNVARFLVGAGMGALPYDPAALARALRPMPAEAAAAGEARAEARCGRAIYEPTFLAARAEAEALAWQSARQRLYGFLHGDHANLAPHAMLRKAIELELADGFLPAGFLDMTDAAALAALRASSPRPAATLAERVQAGAEGRHRCLWEAEVSATPAGRLLAGWRTRLGLEAQLACEAGLRPEEVILEALVSAAGRALPPLAPAGRPAELTWLPVPAGAPCVLHVFVAAGTPPDYGRRLRAAAERRLGELGATPRRGAAGDW